MIIQIRSRLLDVSPPVLVIDVKITGRQGVWMLSESLDKHDIINEEYRQYVAFKLLSIITRESQMWASLVGHTTDTAHRLCSIVRKKSGGQKRQPTSEEVDRALRTKIVERINSLVMKGQEVYHERKY